MKKQNIIVFWMVWHFYEMPAFLFLVWKNYISFISDFFSISLLVKTLFSPWRKYKSKYPSILNLGESLGALIYNTFSMFVGIIGRSVLIILGVIALIFILILGGLIILCWLLLPFALIGLVLLLVV